MYLWSILGQLHDQFMLFAIDQGPEVARLVRTETLLL